MLDDNSNWALLLIKESGAVEGVTRLHKYAFLIAKRVKDITKYGFYNDWKASDYGPYSPTLAADIKKLRQKGLIQETVKTNQYGYKVAVLSLAASALHLAEKMRDTFPHFAPEIKKYVEMYQNKRLIEILHDVYYLYPEYAIQSKIKAEVGRQIYESDSYLNPEYDEPRADD